MLSDADRARVEAAVARGELRTRGEIYTVVARESSDYREVPVTWAAIAALAVPALLLAGGVQVSAPEILTGQWSAAQIGAVAEQSVRSALTWALLMQGVLFVAVALLVGIIPPLRRLLTPKGLKRERVLRRAQEQFLAKNLAATRERTGVLIYVSAKERMAELIADEGVASKVDPKVWDEAMAALISGIKRKQPAEGFEAAIGLCADILAQHFPANATDNPNELPDSVVVLP
ncbi:TPM domain-containing protein [Phenylobacterium ferrooxidans]|uniref:TPM domain-containing protein n=1 Tax=Phenylobacterium ferrooxidans TaxID=2982689 RepID=A0ABW6CV39_9CAUL